MTFDRVRPRPGSKSFEERFESAFLAADYERCHALLEEQPETPLNVLNRAEVWLRERKYPDVIRVLSALKTNSTRNALKRDELLGAAYGCTREYGAAIKRLRKVIDATPPDDPLNVESHYHLAQIAWMDRESAVSESELDIAIERGDHNLRTRAWIVRSWVYARRRELKRQVEALDTALAIQSEASKPDQLLRASAIFTLAVLAREMALPETLATVRRAAANFPWTNSLRVQQFQVTRLLAWTDALAGNELQAFRGLKAAQQIAPSPYWQVICLLDRASLARATGEIAFAEDQTWEADRQAQQLNWSDTNEEERSALLLLAERFAEVDPPTAQRYLAQFRSISTPVLPMLAYSGDARVRAFAQYSAGVALSMLGEAEEAEAALREAWQIFEDFEYGWRSALTALALYETTRDEHWLTRAEQRIAPWPNSWIARKVARGTQLLQTQEISGAQAEVLALLLQGKKNAAIAQELGKSPHTIRNHIAQIFQKLRVSSRAELIAKQRR